MKNTSVETMKKYNFNSVEDVKKYCLDFNIDVEKIVREIQPISRAPPLSYDTPLPLLS